MSTFLFILLITICTIIILTGLAGIFLPILPGVPLVWLGIFIFAVFTGFEKISVGLIIIFVGLTILSFVFDYIAQVIGVKKFGASRRGIAGAIVGTLFGFFSLSLVGVIIGPIISAFIFELIGGRPAKKAFRASLGSFLGFLGGILAKFVLSMVMIGIFLWRLVF